MKPDLSFYTNMPTPYQLDFFNELKDHFNLEVIYFSKKESDREWELPAAQPGYRTKVLANTYLAKIVQRRIVSFHFSLQIFKVAYYSASKFVIVNGTYWSPNVVAALLISKWRGKKVYFLGEKIFSNKNRLFAAIKKNVLMMPVKVGARAIFAIGEAAALSYQALGFKGKIINIPYNINLQSFQTADAETEKLSTLKNRWSPNGELIFLSSGSLIHRKGMDTVIKAFQQVSKKINSKLIIIGDGPDRQNLVRLIGECKNIHLVGFIQKDTVPYYFALADVFVFASRYDGWGLVINEAVAAHLPIICSFQTAAGKELIAHGVNGFLCDAENVLEYAECMMMLADPELRSKMGVQSEDTEQSLSSKFNANKVYEFCLNDE